MASSETEIVVPDSTTQSETAAAEPAKNTVTIDDVFTASMYGDFEKLRKFVEQDGSSLSLPDALQWAAINNHPEIVEYIIEHDGDVNAVDNSQKTALHWAAIRGFISVADLLLQKGARVEAADWNGFRAVHFAAQYGQTSFLNHIVDKHNADFDVSDDGGRSPLHWAASEGFADTVRLLLSRGASQERQDKEGFTPLHWAAIKGNLEVCVVLVDAGTKQAILVKNKAGQTPCQLAYSKGYCQVALLLARGKHLENSKFMDKALREGKHWPVIIALQGEAYTGKSRLAKKLAKRLKCQVICLDDFLETSEPTYKLDDLISHTFCQIVQIVKTQISLGLSVIVDSPLSRRSHLDQLVALISTRNSYNTQLLIVECEPNNDYVLHERFEEGGSDIYKSSWYKPKANWPLPKLERDYSNNDIPFFVSKLVVDTAQFYSACNMLQAVFDLTSCGCGHIDVYDEAWRHCAIHKDKIEQFTCPHCNTSEPLGTCDDNLHFLTVYESVEHDEKFCGVCDNQVSGPCYSCKDCPLTLHKSCAELARGGKKHFDPESFPRFMSNEPHLQYAFPVERPCAGCREQGKDFSGKCKHCLFESHLKSRLLPTVVRNEQNNIVTLWLNLNDDGRKYGYQCSACKKDGQFPVYFLTAHSMFHPACLLLPPSIHHTHGGHKHDLEMLFYRKEIMEEVCGCCRNMMDPRAWYYFCSICDVSVHLECAFKDFDTGEPFPEGLPRQTSMHA